MKKLFMMPKDAEDDIDVDEIDEDIEEVEDEDEEVVEEVEEEDDDDDLDDEEAKDDEDAPEVDDGYDAKSGALGSELAQMVSDIPVHVVAVLGKKIVNMKELSQMHSGSVVELDRPVAETVDLVANGKLVAKGELVDIDGKLGVKVTKLVR